MNLFNFSLFYDPRDLKIRRQGIKMAQFYSPINKMFNSLPRVLHKEED